MLHLSKKVDYGILILSHLANNPDTLFSARELAEIIPISPSFISKILKDLAKANYLDSTRGAHGGYRFKTDPRFISVSDIITHLDQPVDFLSCSTTSNENNCKLNPSTCPIKHPLHNLHNKVVKLLEETTLAHILEDQPATSILYGSNKSGTSQHVST